MKKEIIKYAPINAGAAASYIMLISAMLFSGIFEVGEPEDNILIPIVMLLLLVISVAVMAIAIFGRSVMWYLDGKKKEAIQLLAFTIGFLMVIALFFISTALF